MNRREPPDVAILSARIMRAYPSLSPYSAASLAAELGAIERAQRRHAIRCCSGEDGGYVRKRDFARVAVFDGDLPRGSIEWRKSPDGRWIVEHDPDAEQRAGERIERKVASWRDKFATLAKLSVADLSGIDKWAALGASVTLQHDPRGTVLLLRLPGEPEAVGV